MRLFSQIVFFKESVFFLFSRGICEHEEDEREYSGISSIRLLSRMVSVACLLRGFMQN